MTFKKYSKRLTSKLLACKRWAWILLAPIVLTLFLLIVDMYVGLFSRGRLYRSIDSVPQRSAALVLGCAKEVEGRPNLYFKFRIDATAQLWHAGKINAIVVSGDNCRKGYDEPSAMKTDLVAKGVPAKYITIDYAGFRTLDSMVRADKVFALEDYVVVSQEFHCGRAIYLARKQGQNVIGYCADDVTGASGAKIRLREVLARSKAVVDVIFSKSPKHLGKQEKVHYRIAG